MAKTINSAFPSINLQDCIAYGNQIVSRVLFENPNQVTAANEAILSINKLFEALKKHPHVSNSLRKHKFEWIEVQRFAKLCGQSVRGYKDALEKEDKILEISATIKQSENSSLILHDVKFKRKEDATAII